SCPPTTKLSGALHHDESYRPRSLSPTAPPPAFSTDDSESAQIPVTAMDLGETTGQVQAQNFPSLESGADVAAASLAGIPGSRRIERACWEDAAFRVLIGNQQPDHSRISDFRFVHLDVLAGLFVQVLRLCQKAGLVSLGTVVLDGTKVKSRPMPPSTRS
ncbi:MAG: transposase, partial [Cyanobacteriota bacterium]